MENVIDHTHNNIDSRKLKMKDSIVGCPMPALTTANSSSFTSGGAAVLQSSDVTILNNMRTRINELESRLQSIEALL